jgi:hypothetical protein
LEGDVMHKLKYILVLVPFILTGCSALKLAPTDFSWPVESVMHVNDQGVANEERYSISFNAKAIYFEETGDSLSYLDRELRIIRDTLGYYFITGNKFNNVYVFKPGEGTLNLDNKITVAKNGLKNPVFNQRPPYIELVSDSLEYYLSNNGIENKEK